MKKRRRLLRTFVLPALLLVAASGCQMDQLCIKTSDTGKGICLPPAYT